MPAISLSITYDNVNKRIACSNIINVYQLVQATLEKFKLDESKLIGELKHNGKIIDPSLPLRLAGLTSSSKIELVVKSISQSHNVNVKLMANLPSKEMKTLLLKFDSNTSLIALIKEFEISGGVQLISYDGYKMQLAILNSKVNEEEFGYRLNSIIGSNVTNVVLRLSYLSSNNAERIKEQNQLVNLQLQQQKLRNQMKKQQEEKERELQRHQEEKGRELQRQQQEQVNKENMTDNSESTNNMNNLNYMDVDSHPEVSQNFHHQGSQIHEKSLKSPKKNSVKEEVKEEFREEITSGRLPISEGPQLFIPSSVSSKVYENPDDDYEMTISQAQTYHQLIRNSASKPKKKVTEASIPNHYSIRIKFPDRFILQLSFPNAKEAKFGNLLKKIDEALLPQFLNYNLKLSFPPFKSLNLSFSTNNTLLIDHPDFQSERILLIWESLTDAKGPYINTQVINEVKESTELPELVLEHSRANLPSESTMSSSTTNNVHVPSSNSKTAKSESKGDQFPKWFKRK